MIGRVTIASLLTNLQTVQRDADAHWMTKYDRMMKERDRLQREVNEYERRIGLMPFDGDPRKLSPLAMRIVEENETLKERIALAELYVEQTRRAARQRDLGSLRRTVQKHLAEVSASLAGNETGTTVALER